MSLLIIVGCVPLDYVEPVSESPGGQKFSRDFYHGSSSGPVVVEYENGTAKGRVFYEIDDPYVDISMVGKNTAKLSSENCFSLDEVNQCLKYYISAQEAIIDDDLELANKSINRAIEIVELKPFFDLKGSIYYLNGDTVKANYYWNYLNID